MDNLKSASTEVERPSSSEGSLKTSPVAGEEYSERKEDLQHDNKSVFLEFKNQNFNFPRPSEARQISRGPGHRRSLDDGRPGIKEELTLNKSVTFSDQKNHFLEVPVPRRSRAHSTPTQSNPNLEIESLMMMTPIVVSFRPPRPPKPPRPKLPHSAYTTAVDQVQSQAIPNPRGTVGQPCQTCNQQLQDFKERFKRARSHKEKYEILTSVPVKLVSDDYLKKEFSCSDFIASGAVALRASQGVFSSPPPQFIQNIPEFVKCSILTFFNDPKNGGEMKGRENIVENGKGKRQKRAMFVSLSQLYQEYVSTQTAQYSSITVSRFVYLAPTDLVWSRRFWEYGHDICFLHENLQLLLSSCTTHYSGGMLQVMARMVCPEMESLCMLGYCDKCPIERKLHSLLGHYSWDEVVEFYYWQETNGNMGMTFMTEPLPQFTTRLDSTIRQFFKHFFISTLQNDYLQQIHSCLSKDISLVLIKMDFCEPYTVVSKIGSKKASKYFNYDPQNTITVYPFVIKYYDPHQGGIQVRNVVLISNDIRDNATSAYLFQSEMMKWLKHTLPFMKNVIYFADDNPRHLKNHETILNLLYHEEDFNLKASLEFTVEGHDLEDAGMIATEVKKKCRIASLKGSAVINCADDMFKYCRKELSEQDLQFCYVDRFISRLQSVEMRLQRRYKLNNGIIPGIDHFYSFQPDYLKDVFKNDTIRVRRYSQSPTHNVMRVSMSSKNISNPDDIISHYVGNQSHPYDESKLIPGNIVTVNLEGRLFTGKVTRDEQVSLGNLGVTLVGRIEEGKGGKNYNVPLVEEMQVWVSTLDVLMVEEVGLGKGEQMKKKKDQKQQQEQTHEEERRRTWSARAISPRRFFKNIRKKVK